MVEDFLDFNTGIDVSFNNKKIGDIVYIKQDSDQYYLYESKTTFRCYKIPPKSIIYRCYKIDMVGYQRDIKLSNIIDE